MFVLPGLWLMLVFAYVRPHEFVPALQGLPLLYLLLAIVFVGFVVDVRLRITRPEPAPHLPFVVLFLVWSLLTTAIKGPATFAAVAIDLGVPITLGLLIGQGIQTFRGMQSVAAVILAIGLLLTYVGIDQGLTPKTCHRVFNLARGDLENDDRPCVTPGQCETADAEPGADYVCERAGMFDTSSAGGRVRYRGILQDPNELSLALGVVIPLVLAFRERRRSYRRTVLAMLIVAAVGLCVVFTKSRGGQLVFLSVLGAYFVRRFGARGLLLGVLLAVPVLAFGGRSGKEAAASSRERAEAWFEGMQMVRSNPAIGVGAGQFTEHHYLTAHNSYVLVVAESGLLGFFLWTTVLYLAFKTVWTVVRQSIRSPLLRPRGPPLALAPVAHTWAMGLLAALAGLTVGIFFLSFSYHVVFWAYMGLTMSFYSAIRSHEPRFEVRFGFLDALLVVLFDVAFVSIMYVWTRLHPP